LPPDPARTFAIVSDISLRTTIDRSLTSGPATCQGVAKIDAAYAGSNTLDLTKTFFPLGKSPGIDAVFYLVSQEVFSKPGANVTLCFDLATTPEQEADELGSAYVPVVAQAAADLVTAVTSVANAAIDADQTFIDFISGSDTSNAQNAITNLKNTLSSFHNFGDITGLTAAFNKVVDVSMSGTVNPDVQAFERPRARDRGGAPQTSMRR